jgi:sucrose-6-phosphate hydrolase SacC (GH32 family)
MSKVFEALQRQQQNEQKNDAPRDPLAAEIGTPDAPHQNGVNGTTEKNGLGTDDNGGHFELPSVIGAPIGPRSNEGALFPSYNHLGNQSGNPSDDQSGNRSEQSDAAVTFPSGVPAETKAPTVRPPHPAPLHTPTIANGKTTHEPARPATEGELWADYGRDCYAAVSWSDIPKSDGRRIFLGWMSNWEYAQDVPTSPWRNAMTIPRELSLSDTGQGLRLIQKPVRELRLLRGARQTFKGGSILQANQWLGNKHISGDSLEVDLVLEPGQKGQCGLRLLKGGDEQTVITPSCDARDRSRRISPEPVGHEPFLFNRLFRSKRFRSPVGDSA